MKRAYKKTRYTITEAARALGVTRQAVNLAIKRGDLEGQKGKITQVRTIKVTVRGWRIPVKSLEAYRSRLSELHQWVGKKT